MANRQRNIRIQLRVTEQEKELIEQKMQELGLNQFTKRVHETGSIYGEDIEDLRKSYDRLWGAAEEIMLRLAAI